MKRVAVAVSLVGIATVGVAANEGDATHGCTSDHEWPATTAVLAERVITLVNDYRASKGLIELARSKVLDASAASKARHMAMYSYMTHSDPNPPIGRPEAERLVACGYPAGMSWGENIALGYSTAEDVVDAWLRSPAHRAQIENGAFATTGVAAASSTGADATSYWVLESGTDVSPPDPARRQRGHHRPRDEPATLPAVNALVRSRTLAVRSLSLVAKPTDGGHALPAVAAVAGAAKATAGLGLSVRCRTTPPGQLLLARGVSGSRLFCTRRVPAVIGRRSIRGCGSSVCVGDSWNAAYRAAAPGAVLTVAGGSHGYQAIQRAGVKNPPVVFQAQGAVSASIDLGRNTVLGPSGIELLDFTLAGSLTTAFSEDVTLRNFKAQSLFVNGGTKRFSFFGGEVGPMPVNSYVGVNTCTGSVPTQCISNQGTEDALFDSVYFHDATVSDNPNNEIHGQCMQINSTGGSIDGLIVRDSIFQNCSDFGVLSYGNQANVLYENNFFDRPMPADPLYQGGGGATSGCNPNCVRDGMSLDVSGAGGTLSNIVVRYNSALGGIRIRNSGGSTIGAQMIGNIMRASGCALGIYRNNISNAQTCGTSDFNVSNFWDVLWLDGNPQDGTMNFHLKAGVAAIDKGDSTNFPALDIDGQDRSGAPDVGADEVGGSPPPPAQCADGLDNDGDGDVDLADDGCSNAADDDESDDPHPTHTTPTETQPTETTPTEPPPTSPTLRKLFETSSIITLDWDPVTGAVGYRFSSAKTTKFSHTWDPSRAQATFSKADWYQVDALTVIETER